MMYDFHANYAFHSHDSFTQGEAADFLTGCTNAPPIKWPHLRTVEDPAARIELLAQALNTAYKDRARKGQLRGKAGGLQHWIESGKASRFLKDQQIPLLKNLGIIPTLPDISRLPIGTWALRVPFRLESPYISRDDSDWYIIDNPVKKEWIFKVPYISASGWKGALLASIRQQIGWYSENRETAPPEVCRLFGITSEAESQSGCLYFYPTFFPEIGLEVINPHPREKGAGEQPIMFECIPKSAAGEFFLLYVPMNDIDSDGISQIKESMIDLNFIAPGIKEMFHTFGFGAKNTSGFGYGQFESNARLIVNIVEKFDPEKDIVAFANNLSINLEVEPNVK